MPSNQGAADSDPPAQERAPAAGRSRKRGGKIEPVVEDASPAQSGPNRNVIAIAIGAVAIVATVVVIVVSRLGGSSGPPVPAGWVRFHSSSPAYRIDYPKTWTPHYRNGTETFVGYGPSSAQGARGPIRAVTVVAQKVDSQTTLPDYLSTGENVLRGQGAKSLEDTYLSVASMPAAQIQYALAGNQATGRVTLFIVHSKAWRIALTAAAADFPRALPTYQRMLNSFAPAG